MYKTCLAEASAICSQTMANRSKLVEVHLWFIVTAASSELSRGFRHQDVKAVITTTVNKKAVEQVACLHGC